MDEQKLGSRFYRVLEKLFEELDQESIRDEVEKMRRARPDAPREEIAAVLTRSAARKAATVGVAAGSAGGAVGLLAMGPDIFNLVRQQSRLVLSIAFLYGQVPRVPERFREVLATLAVSTGAAAGRQGVRRLVTLGLEHEVAEKIAAKIAGKYVAEHVAAVAPIVGGAAGGAINYLSVRTVGRTATRYYARVLEEQERAARGEPPLEPEAPPEPGAVERTLAAAGEGAKRGATIAAAGARKGATLAAKGARSGATMAAKGAKSGATYAAAQSVRGATALAAAARRMRERKKKKDDD